MVESSLILPFMELSLEQTEISTSHNQAQAKPISVTDLNLLLKGTIEPKLRSIWVVGEISGFRPSPSGHVYFTLKDEQSAISAAIFGWGKRSAQSRTPFRDGTKVVAHGRISVYPPRGSVQLVIDSLEPLGAGSLQRKFEELKAKLDAEGLFKKERKRPLPKFPKDIVVLTSPTGAAIRDIINVLGRRIPFAKISVLPSLVQGEGAAAQLVSQLNWLSQARLGDVLVIARGGGSPEDLWSFNDENLARAIAACPIPVIAGIGHEIDFTIADFVADVRAPTPSAAAEILSQPWVDALGKLEEKSMRLSRLMAREIQIKKQELRNLQLRLRSPKDRVREKIQRVDEFSIRLIQAMTTRSNRSVQTLRLWAGKLDALSPLAVLSRGYALVAKPEGALLKSASSVDIPSKIHVKFHDGVIEAETSGLVSK